MNIVKIKISLLKHPEKNVRIHTIKQIEEFVRSIKMFGQIRPVVIDEDNTILAGNGLVEALEQIGIEEAECYKIDNLTENQKKKLMIADNKIFSLGIENLDTLNSFLEDLDGDLDVPGFDEDILRSMVADADEITEKISEYGTLDDDEIQEIKEKAAKAPETPPAQKPAPQDEHPAETPDPGESEQQDREYVICPKCGEKIWL